MTDCSSLRVHTQTHDVLLLDPSSDTSCSPVTGTGSSVTCKGSRLVCGHSPEVAQVAFVADQHDDNVVVGVVSQLLQPALHIFIGQVFSYVVH